jgi:hypothetical protein
MGSSIKLDLEALLKSNIILYKTRILQSKNYYVRKIDQIVEDLKTLTLLEASELVTKIEETLCRRFCKCGTMVMAAASRRSQRKQNSLL